AEVRAPLTVDACYRLSHGRRTSSTLICSFQRAEQPHAVAVDLDPVDCGSARDIFLLDAARLARAGESTRPRDSSMGSTSPTNSSTQPRCAGNSRAHWMLVPSTTAWTSNQVWTPGCPPTTLSSG